MSIKTIHDFKNLYEKPKFYYFIPVVGWWIYIKDAGQGIKVSRLDDQSTPGGKAINGKWKKLKFRPDFILAMIFSMVVFNLVFFYFKKPALEGIKLNEGHVKHAEHKAAEHKVEEHKGHDHKASEHKAAEHAAHDHKAHEHAAHDHKSTEHKPEDHKGSDHTAK